MRHDSFHLCGCVLLVLAGSCLSRAAVGDEIRASTLYSSDFAKQAGPQWSVPQREKSPKGERLFLGRFASDSVHLTLTNLPDHKYIRLSFDLLVMGKWSGVSTGAWQVGVAGRQPLLKTNFHLRPAEDDPAAANLQSYPAPHPQAMFPSYTGAAAKGTLGYSAVFYEGNAAVSADAIHKITLVFPHSGPNLLLDFAGMGLGKVKELGPDNVTDAAWGLDAVKVEAIAAAPDAAPKSLAAAWDDLGATDAARLWEALGTLVLGGDAAVKLIQERLCAAVDVEAVNKLITKLDDDDFQVREDATKKLSAMGEAIAGTLKTALENPKISAEMKSRLETVLAALQGGAPAEPTDALAQMRGLQALELIDADAAKQAIKAIAVRGLVLRVRAAATLSAARNASAAAEAVLAEARAKARAGHGAEAAKLLASAQAILQDAGVTIAPAAVFTARSLPQIEGARKRLADLKSQLEKEPNNKGVRNALALLLVVELADYDQAAPLMDDGADAALRTVVESYKAGSQPKPAKYLALIDAFTELAKTAPEHARPDLLRIVKALDEAALDHAGGSAAGINQLASMLAKVTAQIAQCYATQDGWIDLIKLADSANIAPPEVGQWQVDEKGLSVKARSFARIGLPVVPEGSYELEFTVSRTAGADGIFVAIPVGLSRGNLNLGGWMNTVSGLEEVGGKNVAANRIPANGGALNNGTEYTYLTKVELGKDQAKITIKLDGADWAQWEGDPFDLGINAIWHTANPRSFAVGANDSDVTFKSIRVRMLDGHATVGR